MTHGTPIGAEQAIRLTRSALGVAASLPGQATRVTRLDGGDAYYLVVVGSPRAAVGVAAVNAMNGDVETSARLPGTGPHVLIDERAARALIGDPDAAVDLVWRPSRASRSQLYPVWRVRSGGVDTYVDLTGRRWPELGERASGG